MFDFMKHLASMIRSLLAAGTILAASTASLQGAVISYSDRPTFLGAAGATVDIDFEGLASPGSFVTYPSGVTLSGVTFTSSTLLWVVDPGYAPSFYDWGSGAVMLGESGDTITAVLPGGVRAVGSDLMSILPYAGSITVGLSTGDSFAIPTSPYPTRTFFGAIADVDIAYITFDSTSGAYPEIDNFVFGTGGGAVPEFGSTLGLVALALGGLLTSRRLRR